MTEIPEHLLKRAEEARRKAAISDATRSHPPEPVFPGAEIITAEQSESIQEFADRVMRVAVALQLLAIAPTNGITAKLLVRDAAWAAYEEVASS
jgi:hypothetical protein